MDVSKIKELIAELEQDIQVKIDAISGLEKLLASMNGHKAIVAQGQMVLRDSIQNVIYSPDDSYVDLTVKIIEANEGRPMTIQQVVDRIKTIKNNPNIERRSVEATLYRHITDKGDSSRIIKPASGMYGIRRFPRTEESAA